LRSIVVGVGNPLRSDDAVGLHVARRVRERLADHDGVDVTELWAGGLRLAEAMAGYDRAVVVDALATGQAPPGSIRRLELSGLGAARNLASAHDASLPAAVATWRALGLPLPDSIVVIGVAAADTETLGETLSAPLAAALPAATAAVIEALLGTAPACPGERP